MATRKVAARYDAALEPTGINVAQYAMLRAIERRQPVSLTELGRALDLDRSTMGRNIRVVEKLGLVATGRGDDQRESVVRLTDHGATVLRKAGPLWEGCQTDIEARIGAERLQALADINTLL
ncbi:MarR family winged helix-turn-helix transcriptional regulator [Azospirillum oleiclasticum]|nr:MarR family winged helix-turn-helix transcriptional regulator [Azospirillum oleiclasticum]